MFSTSPLRVLPFTEGKQAIVAGIAATVIGRGLMNTDIGRAMLAAIGEFDGRPYSGSRIIMLVSDGGAQLDAGTRKRIETALARHRIALYWIYLRTGNSPRLHPQAPGAAPAPQPHRALLDFPAHGHQSAPAHRGPGRRVGAGDRAAPFLPGLGHALSR